MEKNYRPLDVQEIQLLEQRGCQAEDWSRVLVAPQFDANALQQVRFFGDIRLGVLNGTLQVRDGLSRPCGIRNAELHDVTVGDHCLIENIGSYLSKVEMDDECYLSQVGTLECVGPTTFAQGKEINVLSEVGEELTLVLHRELSAQEAFLLVRYGVCGSVDFSEVIPQPAEVCHLGKGVHLIGTRTLRNVWLGDGTRVEYASLLSDVTVDSLPDRPTVIGSDCILRESIVSETAEVLDGAKVEGCFIGQATHLGLGFSATNSVFFANCYMDNGEACSVVAGPFTVSHHKCSLLIGALLSFSNIGSGTNMSNHAYKMGPIHHGFLRQGVKTASNTHLIWPGTIGAFSVVSGKTVKRLDTTDFPFSYIFCDGEQVHLVPAVNGVTYGTFRDIMKWSRRDKRHPEHKRDIVCATDLITPELMEQIKAGKEHLKTLKERSPQAPVYTWKGMLITVSALNRGIELYEFLEYMFWGFMSISEAFISRGDKLLLKREDLFDAGWTYALGAIVPTQRINDLLEQMQGENGPLPVREIHRFWENEQDMFYSYRYTWGLTKKEVTREKLETFGKNYYHIMKHYLEFLQEDLKKEHTKGSLSADGLQAESEKLNRSFDMLLTELKHDYKIK